MDYKKLEEIYASERNGQMRQFVEFVDEYGLYDFWSDYAKFLWGFLDDHKYVVVFTNAVISYHRIKNR